MTRERHPEDPRCSDCRGILTDPWELGERFCWSCSERLRCQDEAHHIGKFHGLYVRWTDVRDHGQRVALEIARNKALGINPKTVAAERDLLMAGEEW